MAVSSISAGALIRELLMDRVGGMVNKVFPIVVGKADLPYISYRRTGMEANPAKGGGADLLHVQVTCYTEDYDSGLELAEAVREAMDYKQFTYEGLYMRSCTLTDSEEGWEDDAYIQVLSFDIRINFNETT